MSTFHQPKTRNAAHDTGAPPNLIQFMLTRWKPSTAKPSQIKNLEIYEGRRERLSARFPGEVLLLPSGHQKVRANDTFYPFRPCSDFYYLTGNLEPDCVLALVPDGQKHSAVLFVEPNPGKTDATFFTDRVKGELWEGARLGVPESRVRYGIEDCRPLAELEPWARALGSRPVRLLRGFSDKLEGWTATREGERDRGLAEALSEMRLIKDALEIRELTAVVDSTQRGFEDVLRRLRTAKSERELEGVFFTRARMEGNDVGYGTIVASGAHACTLHWKRNDGRIKKGDLLLLDAGIEGNALYTADITRTFPIGGKFSREQKAIYELVHAAQTAAFEKVQPGNDFMEPNRAAMEVLAQGLHDLKLLSMPPAEALAEENQFYKRYSLHNVSHMLGLEVHDCAQARAETYKFGKLVPGMVLTVEPGLYFQPDDLSVPARYRGIGVRIEDDVVVTAKGYRNLSAEIPSEARAVERWMKSLR